MEGDGMTNHLKKLKGYIEKVIVVSLSMKHEELGDIFFE
jgi:hypothetical protein